MATSTVPAAIDYLVATVTALPACAAPVVVCDGWPDQAADVGVVIGVTPDDAQTDIEHSHAALGAQTEWEQYDIPCYIWAHSADANAMKAARDKAFSIFDAIDTHLRTVAGRTLGGVLKSGAAYAIRAPLEQTATAVEAGTGRVARVPFVIRCKSRSTA